MCSPGRRPTHASRIAALVGLIAVTISLCWPGDAWPHTLALAAFAGAMFTSVPLQRRA